MEASDLIKLSNLSCEKGARPHMDAPGAERGDLSCFCDLSGMRSSVRPVLSGTEGDSNPR
jgi:hypothetical protein